MTGTESSLDVGELSIGEVSRRTGQTVVTLRYWETIGLLPPPPRTGGKRRYPETVLSHIAMIDLVRRAGFSLQEARELLSARNAGQPPAAEWRTLMVLKQAELDQLLETVQAARKLLNHLAGCRCRSFEECLTYVVARSFPPALASHDSRRDRGDSEDDHPQSDPEPVHVARHEAPRYVTEPLPGKDAAQDDHKHAHHDCSESH
jgi:MerR family redox-sensitive transcriptional activator SoxR